MMDKILFPSDVVHLHDDCWDLDDIIRKEELSTFYELYDVISTELSDKPVELKEISLHDKKVSGILSKIKEIDISDFGLLSMWIDKYSEYAVGLSDEIPPIYTKNKLIIHDYKIQLRPLLWIKDDFKKNELQEKSETSEQLLSVFRNKLFTFDDELSKDDKKLVRT